MQKITIPPQWKAYTPALMGFLVGLFFLWVPYLAVFLVVSLIFTISAFYAFLVYKIQQAQRDCPPFESQEYYYSRQEPTFRNVTILMKEKGKIFRQASFEP